MKKHTNKYFLIVTILVSTFFLGCEKSLDKELQNALTQSTFPVSSQDALLATNAVYSTLRNTGYHQGTFPILDIMSDDARKGSNPNDAANSVGPYDNFTFRPTGQELGNWWATLYEGIKRANVVIEKVPSIEMETTLRNRYIAEARFLRALYYFDLVRAWGGVPKVTSTTPSLKLARSSKEEIYSLITDDLNFAIQNLPVKSTQPQAELGRATKGAAQALLAKVYIFQNKFTEAEKYALDVINSNEYDLEPIFTDANGVNGEHGIESVFEIGASGTESSPGNQYANIQGVRGNPNRGWGFNRPTPNLRSSFEPGDPRIEGTIIDLGQTIDGIIILGDGLTPDETRDALGNILETECYSRKVWTPGSDVASQFAHNRRLLRYADVLLMAAEALNESGKPDDALVFLNKIRARARQGNNTILPNIIIKDKNALRDLILLERRHELALEGHRFWDLVRTGKAATVLGPLGFISGKNELLPIPQSEIDISQKILEQNPNWK